MSATAAGVEAAGTATSEETLVDVRHVVKDFALRGGAVIRHQVATLTAVADVSLTVARGEIFGLVGESGCGKTTLGRMIATLERPTSGEVWVAGTEIGSLPVSARRPMRRSIQMMFQDAYASLDPRMRIGEIVREPLVIHRMGSRAEHGTRVAQLLDEVGLSGQIARRYPHELSGGQRQRVGLARALALNPKLIVADEPVSALDVCIRAQILNLLVALHRAHGLTYVVISHDLSVIRYIADRVAVMYLGKIVETGPTGDVYARPAHPYTSGLIRAIPVAEARPPGPRAGAESRGEPPSPVDPPSGCRYRTRCPRAQDVCAEEAPQPRTFGPRHVASCHFPLREPETTEAA